MTNQPSGKGTRNYEITDRVWVRDGSFELDRQRLQDERYTLSLDHCLGPFGPTHLIPQRPYPFDSRLRVEEPRVSIGKAYTRIHSRSRGIWLGHSKSAPHASASRPSDSP